jgi:hypothetical protein
LFGHGQQRHETNTNADRTPPVDAMLAPTVLQPQHSGHDHERHDPDRNVDQKDPAPPRDPENLVRTREEPADNRPEHTGRPEDREEIPLVARSFAGRHQIPHDRRRQREKSARAEPLPRPESRQRIHRVGKRAGRRPDDEDCDRREEETLAPVDVRQLPVQRRRRNRRTSTICRCPRRDVSPAFPTPTANETPPQKLPHAQKIRHPKNPETLRGECGRPGGGSPHAGGGGARCVGSATVLGGGSPRSWVRGRGTRVGRKRPTARGRTQSVRKPPGRRRVLLWTSPRRTEKGYSGTRR